MDVWEVAMQVLWWLVPPLAATCLAMLWAGWAGRRREEAGRDDSEAALLRMKKALSRPAPRSRNRIAPAPKETIHGVAVRGAARRPPPNGDVPR
ncbi:MAG: hypothetical protein H0U28_01410 [Nocardioidaceae bacterium]|nr:hypothetical protein [Nocardioidaceae bacterium]